MLDSSPTTSPCLSAALETEETDTNKEVKVIALIFTFSLDTVFYYFEDYIYKLLGLEVIVWNKSFFVE